VSHTAFTVSETSQAGFDRAPLPNGWRWVRLGEVCEFIYGSGLPSHTRQNGIVPVYGSNGIVGYHDEALTKGATIIVGRKGSIGEVHYSPVPCYPIDTTYFIEQTKLDANLTWLVFWLRALNLHELNKAAAIPGLNRTDAYSLEIPFPPPTEQKRIAAILNEQMAAVEQARAAAEAQLKAAKDLPAAYLRHIFDSSEARQWAKKRIGDVALLVQNGLYKAAEHYGHGHPFLRMYNVQNNSWTLNLDRMALVNLEGNEEQTFALKRGDLLISRVNSFELVGKCAWVSPDAEGFIFENMLIRVQLDSSVNSLFVAQQMATDAVRKQIEAVAKRAIGQASINSADLRAIEIALPSSGVQEQMANELSARVAAAEQASKALQVQLNTIKRLPAALLRQAFTGKL
jgi:type I restriction enzyme S subunit